MSTNAILHRCSLFTLNFPTEGEEKLEAAGLSPRPESPATPGPTQDERLDEAELSPGPGADEDWLKELQLGPSRGVASPVELSPQGPEAPPPPQRPWLLLLRCPNRQESLPPP